MLCDEKRIADLCRSMANQGRRASGGEWLEHVRLGYNYRLGEIQAALGVAQLKRLREILQKRERAALLYSALLGSVPKVESPFTAPYAKRSWFVYVIKLAKGYTAKQRDGIIRKLAKKGIQCSSYFQSIHLQPFYRKQFGYRAGMFPVAESASQRTIALPFFTNITERQIDIVVSALRKIMRNGAK